MQAVILKSEDGGQQFAAPFTDNKFTENVMLAAEYREQQRLLEEENLREESERITQEEAEDKAEHARLVKKYGAGNAKLIEDGSIRLGFTKAMVEEAWGSLSDVTRVTNALGTVECWIYGLGSYVYFRGGKVVQIID